MTMRRLALSRSLFAALLLALASTCVDAGYEAGVEAMRRQQWEQAFGELTRAFDTGDWRAAEPLFRLYQRGLGTRRDPQAGVEVLKKAAAAGNTLSMRLLSQTYGRGEGVTRDPAAARQWAEKAVAAGEPAGHLDYFMAHVADPRYRYLGDDGKPDAAKYSELAGRPVEARGDDIRAYTHLAAAAARGVVGAPAMLGVFYFETVGRDAVARAKASFAAAGKLPPPIVQLAKAVNEVAATGPTQTSAKLFLDTQRAVAAKVGLTLKQRDPDFKLADCKEATLPRVQSASPVQDALYLPIVAASMKDAYLLRGKWTERWVFTACGKQVPIDVSFEADGFGGARFTIRDPA